MSLKDKAKEEAVRAAGGLLARWMDRIAAKPYFPRMRLVERFRAWRSKDPQRAGETAEEYVKRIVEEAEKRRKR